MTEVLEFLAAHWELISLLVTNVIAYFVPSPTQRKKEKL